MKDEQYQKLILNTIAVALEFIFLREAAVECCYFLFVWA